MKVRLVVFHFNTVLLIHLCALRSQRNFPWGSVILGPRLARSPSPQFNQSSVALSMIGTHPACAFSLGLECYHTMKILTRISVVREATAEMRLAKQGWKYKLLRSLYVTTPLILLFFPAVMSISKLNRSLGARLKCGSMLVLREPKRGSSQRTALKSSTSMGKSRTLILRSRYIEWCVSTSLNQTSTEYVGLRCVAVTEILRLRLARRASSTQVSLCQACSFRREPPPEFAARLRK